MPKAGDIYADNLGTPVAHLHSSHPPVLYLIRWLMMGRANPNTLTGGATDGTQTYEEIIMFKRLSAIVLAALLIHPLAYARPISAISKAEKEAQFTAKVKESIGKLGVGKETRVAVKLRDHTKLTGFVSKIEAERFIVTDAKTGDATAVAYSDVTQVKGQNLSTGAKIAIGIAIGVGATLLVLYLISLSFD